VRASLSSDETLSTRETEDCDVDTDIAAFAERLYQRHPKKKNRTLAEHQVVKMAQTWNGKAAVVMQQIDAAHSAWCATDDWKKENGRFCPPLDQWLDDRGYEAEPQGIPGW
jgi:hypothetical protein